MFNGYRDQEPEADVPVGCLGYDAPSNIGIMMLGWVYGDGDFSKSICIAAGCCEDGDCTAGTLGALLGIMGGTSVIDEKWLKPIGDEIKTVSIDRTKGNLRIPNTVTELTSRVIRLMPVFMHGFCSFDESGRLSFAPVDSITKNVIKTGAFSVEHFADEIACSPVCVRKSNLLFDVRVLYDGDLNIQEGAVKHFSVRVKNHLHSQQWLTCRLHLPEGWSASPSDTICLNLDQFHGGCSVTEFTFSITPQAVTQGDYQLLLELSSHARPTKMFLTLPLLTAFNAG
jgi:hypothetical protein